jgi:hypothetical protein
VSAVTPVASLEARDTTCRGLRIEFFRVSDRYSHRILAEGCEELPVLLLESVEGTADNPWPPSPAFQALNIEDLNYCNESTEPSTVAMLVGMSGSTHWSMSVRPLSNHDSQRELGRQPGFYFDAAGRLKSVPKVLSTRYSVGKRVRAQRSGDGVLLHFGSGRCQLDSRAVDGTIEPNGWQIVARANELRHELSSDQIESQIPTTIRWGYMVQLLVD